MIEQHHGRMAQGMPVVLYHRSNASKMPIVSIIMPWTAQQQPHYKLPKD